MNINRVFIRIGWRGLTQLRNLRVLLNGLYWLILLHIPWPNNGGYGMNLPMNLLTWALFLFIVLITGLQVRDKHIKFTPTLLFLTTGAILFTLPLLWSPHDGLAVALPRIIGIWSGILLYFTLLQKPLREKELVIFLYLLAAAGVIETVVSLAGIFYPAILPFPLDFLADKYKGYAPGIFQQLNVTASFLATALAALLYLYADRARSCLKSIPERIRLTMISLSVIVISLTLVLFHSRIGWIGGGTAVICMLGLFCQKRYRDRTSSLRRLMLVILPGLGGVIGSVLLQQPVIDSLIHAASSHQRILTLEYTLRMIAVHPWKGWGLGMFEPAYQNFMAALPYENPNGEMMQHPHNEALFIMAEGGVVALLGGLSLLWGWIILWRRPKSLWQWAALLTTLPVLLHTQVEFPLYYSVAHFIAILFLMVAAEGKPRTWHASGKCLNAGMVAAALFGLLLSMQLFSASLSLGQFEAGRLKDPESIVHLHVPWLMQTRYQHDLTLLHLLRFNQSGEVDELEIFARENGEWITLHMEEDAYNSQINVLYFLNRRAEARSLKTIAHRLMPWDDRFKQ